jgi:hypothetical protein
MYKYNKQIGIVTFGFWGLLGFKRGINAYDYGYKKNKTAINASDYLYSSKIMTGLGGTLLYLHPLFLCQTIPKEIYRLELNLRGINHDNDDYYNKLWF